MENQVAVSQGREFTVGSVLSRTLDTFKKHFVLFFCFAIAAQIIPTLITLIMPQGGSGQGVGQVIGILFGLLIQGAVVYAVYQVLRNREVSFGESITKAMGRLVPLLLTAVVCFIILLVCIFVPVFIGALLLGLLGLTNGVIMFVFFAILMIPAIVAALMLCASIPACMVENLGPIDSIKRSCSLTQGSRLKILALFIIVFIIMILLVIVISGIIGFIIPSYILIMLILFVVLCIPQAFGYIMFAVIYYDLRAAKEGISVDALSDVFN